MAENIIHELNAKFNDMELKCKNKSENMVVGQEDSNVNRKSNDTEDHAFTHSKDITHICTVCGGKLYAVITKDDVLNAHLLICSRCCEQPNTAVMDNFYDEQHNKPMGAEENTNYQRRQLLHSNGGYMSSYNSLQSQNMAAMQNHDYRFNLTTDLMAAQTAHLMQLLDTIDCDNCYSENNKEKPTRFKATKRRNVRRTEYQLSGRRTYRSNGPSSALNFSADLSSMATGMYECSEHLRRFHEQLE